MPFLEKSRKHFLCIILLFVYFAFSCDKSKETAPAVDLSGIEDQWLRTIALRGAEEAPFMKPIMPAIEGTLRGTKGLDTKGDTSHMLLGGRCYRALGRSTASASRVTLFLYDHRDRLIRKQSGEGNAITLGARSPICPDKTGLYRLEAKAKGQGRFALLWFRSQ